ncbi:MAG: GxxExxY protein [Planctomycetota bacterium]
MIVQKEESYEAMGACFEVYKEMGSGFLEAVYQECLERELLRRRIPFESQVGLSLAYKGEQLRQTYTPDFFCYGKIILEIKAVNQLADTHRTQLHNYLKATPHRVGILANFGHHPQLEYERIVRQ